MFKVISEELSLPILIQGVTNVPSFYHCTNLGQRYLILTLDL